VTAESADRAFVLKSHRGVGSDSVMRRLLCLPFCWNLDEAGFDIAINPQRLSEPIPVHGFWCPCRICNLTVLQSTLEEEYLTCLSGVKGNALAGTDSSPNSWLAFCNGIPVAWNLRMNVL
jgi:hypothetical protein